MPFSLDLSRFRRRSKPAEPPSEPPAEPPAEGAAEPSLPEAGAEGGGGLDFQYDGLGSLLLEGRSFAVALDWEPRQPEVDVKTQARRTQRSGYRRDLVAALDGQFGFASSERRHRAGARVLVTLARPAFGASWIGAFRVNEADRFFWIGGMREGQVYEDIVLAGEDEARDRLLEALEAPGWTAILAPAAWMIPDARDVPLGALLDLKSGVALRHVDPRPVMIRRAALALALAGVVVGGLYGWSEMQAREAARLEEERRAREASRQLDPLRQPWATVPRLEAVAAACEAAIAASLRQVPGWAQQPIACVADGDEIEVAVTWRRRDGRFPWLLAAIAPEDGVPVLADRGTLATWTRRFPVEFDARARAAERPWAAERIPEVLEMRFQSLGLPLQLRPRVRAVTRSQAATLKAPVFNHHDLTLETATRPAALLDLLADVPAIAPEAVVYDIDGAVWTLSLRVHHPPILPALPEMAGLAPLRP